MKVYIENREVVIPGTLLAEGMDFVPAAGTYREGDKIFASRLGLVNVNKNVLKIVPLAGRYLPKEGDVIIGRVTDINSRGWIVEINSPYNAMMTARDVTNEYVPRDADLTAYLKISDYVLAKVIRVSPTMLVDLSMKDKDLHKLENGRIIKFNPFKIPRVIGKQGSMINNIKKYLNVRFYIGQNGLIWCTGEPKDELIFLRVLNMIDKLSHTSGLTERVEEFLKKAKDTKLEDLDSLTF